MIFFISLNDPFRSSIVIFFLNETIFKEKCCSFKERRPSLHWYTYCEFCAQFVNISYFDNFFPISKYTLKTEDWDNFFAISKYSLKTEEWDNFFQISKYSLKTEEWDNFFLISKYSLKTEEWDLH